jgi:hypothetical protein
MPSRSVEDQEDSETKKNKPPPQPVSPRKKKSSKRRKEETKRKHGGEEPDGSDSCDSDTVNSSESDTDDDRDSDIEYDENGVHVITNTMTSFSTDYRIRSKQSRKIAQIHKKTNCGCKSASTRNFQHNQRRYRAKKRVLPPLDPDPKRYLLIPTKILLPTIQLSNHGHKQLQYYVLHGAGTVLFHLHRQII